MSRPRKHVVATVPLLAVVLLAGCASGGAATPAVEIDDGDQVSERRISLRFIFADDSHRTADLKEGETVILDRPDGVYRVTPVLSLVRFGEIEVEVERETSGSLQTARLTLPPGSSRELSKEVVGGGEWPYLWIKVVRVRPRLNPGWKRFDDP